MCERQSHLCTLLMWNVAVIFDIVKTHLCTPTRGPSWLFRQNKKDNRKEKRKLKNGQRDKTFKDEMTEVQKFPGQQIKGEWTVYPQHA